jgi:anti-sigma B factor antagonist
MLEIQTRQMDPDITILEIAGRITIGRDSKQLEWAVDNLVGEGRKKVIFDLSRVTHIDSTGIGIIVMSAGQVKKAGGELRAAGASGHVEQVLRMTKVDAIVGLHSTMAAASQGL